MSFASRLARSAIWGSVGTAAAFAAEGVVRADKAVCIVRGDGVAGTIIFEQTAPGAPTVISGEVRGLAPGKHGFHIHVWGDLSNGCVTAGPHYNPGSKSHGGPSDAERHVGDLGNLVAGPDGVAKVHLEDALVQVIGPASIVGRSVVVHAAEDDLGKGGHELSSTTGNSGARVACGVIGHAAP